MTDKKKYDDTTKFTEELISVNQLDVDRAVQRANMDMGKVERIVKYFNPDAVGVITVSRRGPVDMVIIDGMHRVEAIRRLSDNVGVVQCRVFSGLTIKEEAQMFLDLNAGTQPTLIDKFRVRTRAGDSVALEIEKWAKAYGWEVRPTRARGVLNCVGQLEKIQNRSDVLQAEPPLLQAILMVVTHSWDLDPDGVRAQVLEALSLLVEEYGSALDLDLLTQRLKNYPGGPRGLYSDGQAIAAMKRRRPAIGVAERLVDAYNKGLKTNSLYAWRRAR